MSEEKRLAYRTRTCLHAEWSGKIWAFGMMTRGRKKDREIIDIRDCPVHTSGIPALLNFLAGALPGPENFPLAFVAITGSLLTLVLKARRGSFSTDGLDHSFQAKLGSFGIKGLFLNWSPCAGNRVFSHRGWDPIWGVSHGEIRVDGLGPEPLLHTPDAFLQLIPGLYGDAIHEAALFLEPGPGKTVVDLYSGIGATMRAWKQAGATTVGVELGKNAVDCARKNSGELCLQGRAADRLNQLPSADCVFANPPRLGLEPEVIQWLSKKARPARIAYLSCSPGTLARDLSLLEKAGYATRRIIPYDFFPQTRHIEALALLELEELRS